MPRSTRAPKEQPPSSTVPSHGYSSSTRGYNINTEGGSHYENGTNRGGSGLSDQPGQIGALHGQLRQDNEPRAESRDSAGRLPEDRNPHGRDPAALQHGTPHGGRHSDHLSNANGSRNIDARAERDTQGSRNQFWYDDEDEDLIDYVRDRYNWTEIAARMGRTEGSVRAHWYYGNLKSDPQAQGVSYRPLRKSGTSLPPDAHP